jgi:hypothetical protein
LVPVSAEIHPDIPLDTDNGLPHVTNADIRVVIEAANPAGAGILFAHYRALLTYPEDAPMFAEVTSV